MRESHEGLAMATTTYIAHISQELFPTGPLLPAVFAVFYPIISDASEGCLDQASDRIYQAAFILQSIKGGAFQSLAEQVSCLRERATKLENDLEHLKRPKQRLLHPKRGFRLWSNASALESDSAAVLRKTKLAYTGQIYQQQTDESQEHASCSDDLSQRTIVRTYSFEYMKEFDFSESQSSSHSADSSATNASGCAHLSSRVYAHMSPR
ncbi:hypothetical protein PHLGIDRAFT_188520 [Phlebiopsis gigantea 11061_1 CR5-6]|uniref:Uncharacterized protein n=1 Tax=Phlebiopsis gigantea (strain 11061_1 CR5-6) TaxID=745531 RepID=A0A0C3S7B1_PHLG1|nr:hypothetical protein PHLGIDRAFT_188520 [Phlebiopsis gigantea 11061_1 CR5-6]